MEGIHGVDVSWLHRSNKDQSHHLHHHRPHAPSTPGQPQDPPPKTSSHGGIPANYTDNDVAPKTPPPPPATDRQTPNKAPAPAVQAPASSTPQPPPSNTTTSPSRPLLGRQGSDKSTSSRNEPKRKSSWLSSLSSKFSSPTTPPPGPSPSASPAPTKAAANGSTPAPTSPAPSATGTAAKGLLKPEGHDTGEPYIPQAPENNGRTSFFSSALRRLSSNSMQSSHSTKPSAHGGICPRRVMNVDKQRERCLIPELTQSKLRRVAFCVDVEIVGGPRYSDDDGSLGEKQKKERDMKMKEKGEGEALKHPQALVEEKDTTGTVQKGQEDVGTSEKPNPEGTVIAEGEKKETTRKKEKKKKSEEERKERKEKRRRKAEENGMVPLEFTRDTDHSGAPSPSITTPRDRPTTDPLRIYRRCCQLRESPILKRIADQLANPDNTPADQPGVVLNLDLTGSRLQPPDFATLGDWLAVVPVKKIILEDAEMTDESVRCVLAGLLAVKASGEFPPVLKLSNGKLDLETRNKSVVEKVVLKNNPRLTKDAWKYICLFINMCKSLTTIDLSMIPFPSSTHNDDVAVTSTHDDVAELLSKALAERLAGKHLEEIAVAECGLMTADIRRIIDGITICGVRRLTLAGNHLDDESLGYVCQYLRSGVCEAIDISDIDLRDRLSTVVSSINSSSMLWGLCLANCNLNAESLKSLFPALVPLPDMRFLDLSHNRDLFSQQPSALVLLRKYIPQLHMLKRLHLIDVSLSPQQAIGLAEVLPESPHLCHLNIQDNPQLTALANAKDETSQEEACALYASFMAAARVSHSLIAIDIAVPAAENCEIVKALAKQIVAYCLRNMERFTADENQNQSEVASAVQSVIDAHASAMEEVQLPDILLHLVGHGDGSTDHSHDNDPPAPCQDYIVSGNGLVKALQYCLNEKESDRKRNSIFFGSGTATPNGPPRDSGVSTEHAKSMSKSLLGSAKKIRTRLQPALAQQANNPDDPMALRRLQFLDNVLENMIQRFEDEFPECRAAAEESKSSTSNSSRANSMVSSTSAGPGSEPGTQPSLSGSQALIDDEDDEDGDRPVLRSRHNSDVNLASRALSMEEGHIHRIGQEVRRSILRPQTEDHLHGTTGNETDPKHLAELRAKLEQLDGEEVRQAALSLTLEEYMAKLGISREQLLTLKEENAEEFRIFREAQEKAMLNSGFSTDGEASMNGEEKQAKEVNGVKAM